MLLINRNLMNTRILLIVFLSFYFGQNISAKGYVFNITDYGAKGDGITLDTKAIQSAINDAAENGGRVVIPGGKYLSGTIFMRSNVTIDLTEGAVLLGSTNIEDYPDTIPSLKSYNDVYCVKF